MTYVYEVGSARDFSKDGVFFRDQDGRYAIFRGVNFAGSAKRPPFLPVQIPHGDAPVRDRFRAELAAASGDLDQLRHLGFNIVRLLVMWRAIEPRPNPRPEVLLPEGEEYLALVRDVLDALYARDILVFVNFHQDIAHNAYDGDGFPDWALAVDRRHSVPTPTFLNTRWGLCYVGDAGPLGFATQENTWRVRNTLASFWRNGLLNIRLSRALQAIARHPQTHYVKTIGATARWFQSLNDGQGHPAILGYNIFNEPHQVGISKQEFERQVLPKLYLDATGEIRADVDGRPGDKRSFIFIQPRVDWSSIKASAPENSDDFTLEPETYLDTTHLEQDRTVFSYHHYDPWTMKASLIAQGFGDSMENKRDEWPAYYERARDAAVERELIPFLSEFGASHDWWYPTGLRPDVYKNRQVRAYMDLQMQQIERLCLSATLWHYNLYNTPRYKDGWNLENFSLLGPNRTLREADIVSRPYPMRSSARPLLVFFDIGTKHCAIVLEGSVVDAPTVVFVPRRFHYTADFEIRASTRAPLEWDETRSLLYWWPAKERHANQLILCPVGAFNEDALPETSRELLGLTGRAIRMPNPFGSLDSATADGSAIRVAGWGIDPNVTEPIEVHAYVDGRFAANTSANAARPDVGAAYPGYGDTHGFDFKVPASPGFHRICIYAINVAAGNENPQLGCADVRIGVPPECQPIQDELDRISREIMRLQRELTNASPEQKRDLLNQINDAKRVEQQKRNELDDCARLHGG